MPRQSEVSMDCLLFIFCYFISSSRNRAKKRMDFVTAKFPQGLPTLQDLIASNKGSTVPPETAWIWGADDEVCLLHKIPYLKPDTSPS